jgi:hypothetical protein
MATLAEIKSAMADELMSQGMAVSKVELFKDDFDRNMRPRKCGRMTTDVEFEELYAYVDETANGYVAVIHSRYEWRRRY